MKISKSLRLLFAACILLAVVLYFTKQQSTQDANFAGTAIMNRQLQLRFLAAQTPTFVRVPTVTPTP